MRVRRIDHGEIKLDAKRTPQGFLRCDAVIARTGVQVYHRADGTQRREYRPPDEVFNADALASCAEAPITFTPDTWNWHPQERVTPDNARKYAVGWTGKDVKADGDLVKTTAVVFDAEAIKAAESGRFQQLSCGYDCDFDMTPGKTPSGEHYDGIQRNIRVNHLAMVRVARAGPEARLRLDAQDNAVFDSERGDEAMEKVIINGVTYEVSPQVAQAISAERSSTLKAHADALAAKDKIIEDSKAVATKLKADADTAQAKADAEKARADAAAKKLADEEKARKDAEDPAKMQSRIAARVALETKAQAILGDEAKLSEKTDSEVKKLVAAHTFESLKLDGKSDAYIEGLFDQAVAAYDEKHPMEEVRRTIEGGKGTGEHKNGGEELVVDAAAAQAEMLKRNREAAQPKAAK